MGKRKGKSICALLCSLSLLVGLFAVSFVPATAGSSDPPVAVTIGQEKLSDGAYNTFSLVFDSSEDYFGGFVPAFNCFYDSTWGYYKTSPMRTSILNCISVEIDGTHKRMKDWGAGATSFIMKLWINADGKWQLDFWSHKDTGAWNDPAAKSVTVQILPGFTMHDGTPVEPIAFTRAAGPAVGSGSWTSSTTGITPPATSITTLEKPNYTYPGGDFAFSARLILGTNWTPAMKAASAEFCSIQNPAAGDFNAFTPATVTAAVNDCIFINGKSIRQINEADGGNAFQVRMISWAVDPANPSQGYWLLPTKSVQSVDLSGDLILQTTEGLIDFTGASIAPISKKWDKAAGVWSDYTAPLITAATEAAKITSLTNPEQGAAVLTLPTVAEGYTVSIKSSSNTGIIALDGTITAPDETTEVKLVLTVSDGAGDTADTAELSITVLARTATTAEQEAAKITSVDDPETGAATLTLPVVADGCTVAIKSSSDTAVIALNGAITTPAEATQVTLVLTVTDSDGNTADTASITVTVPGPEATKAQEEAAKITALGNPVYVSGKVLMPPVADGCTVAIKSSSDTAVVALDGAITNPSARTNVSLVLTVTDGDGNTADTAPLTIAVLPLPEGDALDITVQAPDYDNYTQWGLLFGMRLILPSTYVNGTMTADAVQWAEWKDQTNKNISDELRAGVNDCIFINGKSIRQINTECNVPTMVNVQIDGWGTQQAIHFYPSQAMPASYMNLAKGQNFTIETTEGLVDWEGNPLKPIAVRYIAATDSFIEIVSAQEAAAMTTAIDAPQTGITTLTLPSVGGCSVAIKTSSNTEVVKLDGTIVMPDEDTDVTLVLTFTDGDGNTADTVPITIRIPKKGNAPIVDVSFLSEHTESGFPMFTFLFNTSNDYGLENVYNGLQFFDNTQVVWLPPINKECFRNSIANLLTIQVGDGEAKTISEWGTVWHLAFYVKDGKWVLRFHYNGDDEAVKNWPDKTVTIAFLDGFAFPDGTLVNPMKFQRKAATIGEGQMQIIEGFPTAAGVASEITGSSIPAVQQGDTKLTLPTIMDGYSIKLTYSSKEEVIALDGTITPPSRNTFVTLRFTVTRLSDGSTAETDGISVLVPKGSGSDGNEPEEPSEPENPVNPGDSSTPGASDPDAPVTGDNSTLTAVCMLLTVLAAGGMLLARKHRRA